MKYVNSCIFINATYLKLLYNINRSSFYRHMKNATILLNKTYIKKLKKLDKNLFSNKDSGLLLFVEYLKYIRDALVINTSNDKQDLSKTGIASLVAAIAEFNAYQKQDDPVQKSFHLVNFFEFVKLNMEEWLKLYDSI